MEAARDDLKRLFENQMETVRVDMPATSIRVINTGIKPSAENCSKCGEQHPPRRCKAYGKECFKRKRRITLQNVATATRCW